MASLSDVLKKQRNGTLTYGPDGQLQEDTDQTVQQLAGQAGLAAPPISPAATAAIGGNPDQQKMAGTPQQKQAALAQAQTVQPQQTLQTALRQGQVRDTATAAETAEKKKSADLQNLGSLGDRVSDFIQKQRENLQGAANQAAAGQGVDVQAAGSFTGGATSTTQDLSPLKDVLKQLRANPSDMNLQLQVNQALGYDINTQLSPAQIDQLYESSVDSISRGGAQDVDDKLTVSDLTNLPKFGYDTNTLSSLLGVPADQLQNMTVGQLRNTIQQVSQQEMSKASGLTAQSTSTELGQAERGLAQQGAQEASRTGLRASEDDVNRIVTSIQNADKVQFGGQTYNVNDLLQDSTISGIISDYMNAAPGSDTRKKLEATEPGLIDFINKNQNVLADASKQLQGGAQQFGDIQTANKAVGTFGGQQLNTDLLSQIVPNYGKLSASKVDQTQIPLLNALSQTTDPTQATLSLNSAIAQDKSVVTDIQKLDPAKLNNLLVANNGQRLNQYVNDIKQYNTNQQRDKGNFGSNLQLAFGMSVDPNKLTSESKQAYQRSLLGLDTNSGLTSIGQVVSTGGAGALNNALNQYIDSENKPNLSSAADGADQSYKPMSLPPGGNPPLNQDDQAIYNQIMGRYGSVTPKSLTVDNLVDDAGLDMGQMAKLINKNAGVLSPEIKQQFNQKQIQYAQKDLPQYASSGVEIPNDAISRITSSGFVGSGADEGPQVDQVNNALNQYNALIGKYSAMKNDPGQNVKYGAGLDQILTRLSNEHDQLQGAINQYWNLRRGLTDKVYSGQRSGGK